MWTKGQWYIIYLLFSLTVFNRCPKFLIFISPVEQYTEAATHVNLPIVRPSTPWSTQALYTAWFLSSYISFTAGHDFMWYRSSGAGSLGRLWCYPGCWRVASLPVRWGTPAWRAGGGGTGWRALHTPAIYAPGIYSTNIITELVWSTDFGIFRGKMPIVAQYCSLNIFVFEYCIYFIS